MNQKILNYAIWYYSKYFPSSKKLSQKITEKYSTTDEEIKEIFEELESLIDDEKVIFSKINFYIARGKNVKYIKQKLRENLFEKEDYEKVIEEYFNDFEETILNKNIIKLKIENYLNKGKTKKYILEKLVERKEDKEIVTEILEDFFAKDENLQEEILKKELEKLLKKYDKNNKKDLQKIHQKLFTKGFSFSEIKEILEE